MAEEEASKALVLFDAARCPRSDATVFNRQLSYFNNHLAKALYAECYDFALADVGELQSFFDSNRRSHYLDGPNGFDYIVRNDFEQKRESEIYVDYVDYGDHHEWSTPYRFGRWHVPSPKSSIVEVCRRLALVGAFHPKALAFIGQYWRKRFSEGTQELISHQEINFEMFSLLLNANLLTRTRLKLVEPLLRSLLLPFFPFDLRKFDVSRTDLKKRQEDAFAREMGWDEYDY